MHLFVYFFVPQAGANVEVKHPDKKEFVDATITKLQDCSQYTVGECIIVPSNFLTFQPDCFTSDKLQSPDSCAVS
jgi:hypothetical protein